MPQPIGSRRMTDASPSTARKTPAAPAGSATHAERKASGDPFKIAVTSGKGVAETRESSAGGKE